MSIIVYLALAKLCLMTPGEVEECYPALVGNTTPVGTYTLSRVFVKAPGYGGDILVFKETPTEVFAIHRVWTLKPQQQRLHRLQSGVISDRRWVTGGCINIMPEVYDKLIKDYKNTTIKIVS